MDWKKFIVPITLENSNEKQENGDRKFITQELIYLDDKEAVVNIDSVERVCYPTDYAVMNGAMMSSWNNGSEGRKFCWTWLRSAYSDYNVNYVYFDGGLYDSSVSRTYGSLRPALQLNLSSIISARSASRDVFKIADYKVEDKVKYHTIEFGEYPKTYVGDILNEYIERAMSKGTLKPTGKKYTGHFDNDGKTTYNEEYMYDGKKFVRVLSVRHNDNSEFLDGTKVPENGTPLWARVEPITWVIRNWDEMPRSINPEGTGNAKVIDIQTDEAIISGIPFYPNNSDNNCSMWQNSTIRGYLNGYNVNNITMNGNKDFTAPNGGDFTKNNFLKEAFDMEMTLVNNKTDEELKDYITKKKSRLATINPDTTPKEHLRPMTDTEKIKSWIDNGESVLLRGPSGIGKTERIRREYGDRCIYLKLTNNMFPEKVVGSVNLQTGQEIPPNYAKEAILACATAEERKQVLENIQNIYDIADAVYERSKESDEKIVILLDELLNVKPAVQSLVYTLVLNRFVENGKGLKLPKNVVVVATGNQKKYSSVAEDLAEPLEKRFAHIYDMTPKVNEWVYEYAIPNNLHPSVIGYITSKMMECGKDNITYFYEEPEVAEANLDKNGCKGKTNDPRSWTTISQMLYNFEKNVQSGKYIGKDIEDLLKTSLDTKLREEWASEFFDFYNNPTLSVEDIMNDNYTQEDLPVTINEKFATVSGLLGADITEVEKVRNFISKNCSPEHREVFDLTWANGNVDRMQKIIELKSKDMAIENIKSEEKIDLQDKLITIREFVGSQSLMAISTNEEWKAEYLCKALDKLGKTFVSGESYLKCKNGVMGEWGTYLRQTYYSNKGTYGDVKDETAKVYNIYKFDDIDFSGVLSGTDIQDIEKRLNAQRPLKLSEFWKQDKYRGILVEDADALSFVGKSFDRMGYKMNDGGRRYIDKDIKPEVEHCMDNRRDYRFKGALQYNKCLIYTVDEIDFSEVMTREEIDDFYTWYM